MVGPERPGTARMESGGLERHLARPWRLALAVLLVVGIPTAAVGVALGFMVTTILLIVLLVGAAALLAHTSARVLDALRQQALTDPLTGLYNRRFMDEQLALFDSLAKRHGRPY